MLKSVKVGPKASVIWEHLSQVIIDFPVFTVNPVFNLRYEGKRPLPLLRCVPFFLPSLEAVLASWSSLVPLVLLGCWFVAHIAASSPLPVSKWASGLRWYTRHHLIPFGSCWIPWECWTGWLLPSCVDISQSWGLRPRWLFHMWVSKSPLKLSFLRGWRDPSMFGMSLANALAIASNITPKYLTFVSTFLRLRKHHSFDFVVSQFEPNWRHPPLHFFVTVSENAPNFLQVLSSDNQSRVVRKGHHLSSWWQLNLE